jgi:all-trans-retinol dehydrogenase (NAD+)
MCLFSLCPQTVRTFLDTMIERKRGHIVGISSLGGKITLPFAIAYISTKFGVKGFMGSLYDELCSTDTDQYVKLTTVYPSTINTCKDLSDILDQTKELGPRMSPLYVANEVVKGILVEKSDITLPYGITCLQIVKYDLNENLKTEDNIFLFQFLTATSHKVH